MPPEKLNQLKREAAIAFPYVNAKYLTHGKQANIVADIQRAAYIAGASAHSSGCVWVKASDRLPPNTGSPRYHFRIDGFHKIDGNFHYSIDDERCEGDIVFTVQGYAFHEDYIITNEKFCNLEWLDESGNK